MRFDRENEDDADMGTKRARVNSQIGNRGRLLRDEPIVAGSPSQTLATLLGHSPEIGVRAHHVRQGVLDGCFNQFLCEPLRPQRFNCFPRSGSERTTSASAPRESTPSFWKSFPFYTLQVMAISVTIAWLYMKTRGSLFLTMLLHAAIDNTKDIVPSAVSGATSPWTLHASLVGWLTLAILWICATWFMVDMRRDTTVADLMRTC